MLLPEMFKNLIFFSCYSSEIQSQLHKILDEKIQQRKNHAHALLNSLLLVGCLFLLHSVSLCNTVDATVGSSILLDFLTQQFNMFHKKIYYVEQNHTGSESEEAAKCIDLT